MKTTLLYAGTLVLALWVIALVACAAPTATPVPPTQLPAPIATAIPLTSAPALPTPTPRPLPQATIRVGDLDRTYLYYVPANLPRNAPLLFALHPDNRDGVGMRAATVYEFESLADQNGFIVGYPNGYPKGWNACEKLKSSPAQTANTDDVGFVRALIAKFHSDYGINISRVFAMGYSSGGALAYRLALELPEGITAVAAIGANLPTEDNFDCRASGKPIPVLIMNGTADLFNPYNGGVDAIGAALRSVQATAEYFAKLNGQTSSPKTTRLPHQDPSDPTSVDRIVWSDTGKPEVILVRINEGGHTVPQPKIVFPSNTGRTNKDLNGLVEIWEFFARQRSLK